MYIYIFIFFIPKTFFNRLCIYASVQNGVGPTVFPIVNLFISHTRVMQNEITITIILMCARGVCSRIYYYFYLLLFKARDTAILGQRTGSELIHGQCIYHIYYVLAYYILCIRYGTYVLYLFICTCMHVYMQPLLLEGGGGTLSLPTAVSLSV